MADSDIGLHYNIVLSLAADIGRKTGVCRKFPNGN